MRDQDAVACEREEAPERDVRRRGAPELGVADPREGADRRRERPARADERLECAGRLQAAHADRADLTDLARARRETRRLQVDDDEGCGLQGERIGRVSGEDERRAGPREPGVGVDDVVEEGAGEPRRRAGEREERARGLGRRYGTAALLDELDEPVCGVQAKLHDAAMVERMFGRRRRLRARRGPAKT